MESVKGLLTMLRTGLIRRHFRVIGDFGWGEFHVCDKVLSNSATHQGRWGSRHCCRHFHHRLLYDGLHCRPLHHFALASLHTVSFHCCLNYYHPPCFFPKKGLSKLTLINFSPSKTVTTSGSGGGSSILRKVVVAKATPSLSTKWLTVCPCVQSNLFLIFSLGVM